MKIGIFCALAALMAATPVFADDLTCKGSAEGPQDSSVDVDFTLNAAGSVTDRTAAWSPPAKLGGGKNIAAGAPTVTIEYTPTEAGLGSPTVVMAFNMLLAPRNVVDGGQYVATLDGDETHATTAPLMVATAASQNKSDKPVTLTFGFVGAGPKGGPSDTAFLTALDAAKTINLSLVKDHKVVGLRTVADVSNHAARDALFQTAWAAAVKAAQNPGQCVKPKK